MRHWFYIILLCINIFFAGSAPCFADEPEAEPGEEEPQKEEFNWLEAIDQILGIEIEVVLPVYYYGNSDTRLGSLTGGSTMGCSAIVNVTSLLGAGFYLKISEPSQISGESDYTISTKGDYEAGNVLLFDMLFGPVFTYPSNRSKLQLKLALGYHIALFHFNVSDAVYEKFNTEEYYRKYTGFGGNLTGQIYLSYKTYVYLRMQYSYGHHSGYSGMHAFTTSFGFGISIPNLFKTFPEKEKEPEKEEAVPAGESSG